MTIAVYYITFNDKRSHAAHWYIIHIINMTMAEDSSWYICISYLLLNFKKTIGLQQSRVYHINSRKYYPLEHYDVILEHYDVMFRTQIKTCNIVIKT